MKGTKPQNGEAPKPQKAVRRLSVSRNPYAPSTAKFSERIRRSVGADKMTLEETVHFNKQELNKLYTEFRRICDRNGYLDMNAFRQSLGVLGMVQDSLLCQRLFSVFNKSRTGLISFEEYALSLGVLMKGTVDEKLDFAFAMTDIDGSGEITYQELMITIESIMRIYAGIMGTNSIAALNERKIKKMFKRLDKNGDGMLTLDEYKRGMKRHPEFVTSLRGSDIYTNAQSRALEAQKRSIRRYKKASVVLERQVERAIDLAETIDDLKPNPSGVEFQRKTGIYTVTEQGRFTIRSSVDISEEVKLKTENLSSETTNGNSICHKDEPERCEEKSLSRSESRETILSYDSEDSSGETEIGVHGSSVSTSQTQSSVPAPQKATLTAKEELIFTLRDIQSKLLEMTTDEFLAEKAGKKGSRNRIRSSDKSYNALSVEGNPSRESSCCRESADAVESGIEYGSEDHYGDTDEYETDGKSDLQSSKDVSLDKYLASSSSTVFFGHKNWDLVINVMKGIQMAVGRCAAEAPRPISVFDFGVKEKYTLIAGQKMYKNSRGHPPTGVDLDARSCRFVDYAPFVFNKLREHFGIRNEDYVHSIGPGNMISNLMLGSLSSLSEQGSEGKSGSFFYITSDGLYMVKTLHREEHKQLRAILPQYFHHITSAGKSSRNGNKPDTLLTWILGCHVIRLSKHSKIGADKIYLVVMNNILNSDLSLPLKFDLKGSWTGRKHSLAERQKAKVTLKDVDFTEMKQKIRVGPERKAQLMASIRRDCHFLEELQLIDYSLLIGIHKHSDHGESIMSSVMSLTSEQSGFDTVKEDDNHPNHVPVFREYHGGMRSEDGKETYVMGIIDFLTMYNRRKKAERVLKTIQYLDNRGISVQPPKKYAHRFIEFFEKHII